MKKSYYCTVYPDFHLAIIIQLLYDSYVKTKQNICEKNVRNK